MGPKFGPVFETMKITRARFKHALRLCRSQSEQLESDSMASSLSQCNHRDFWKRVNRKKNASVGTANTVKGISGDKNIAEFWRDHYNSLLNSVHDGNDGVLLDERLSNSLDDNFSFTSHDIDIARGKLKLRKSVGLDGVSSEHLKYAPSQLNIHLAMFFNSMLRHAHIPDLFMPVTIVPIVKILPVTYPVVKITDQLP